MKLEVPLPAVLYTLVWCPVHGHACQDNFGPGCERAQHVRENGRASSALPHQRSLTDEEYSAYMDMVEAQSEPLNAGALRILERLDEHRARGAAIAQSKSPPWPKEVRLRVWLHCLAALLQQLREELEK